MVIYNNYCFLYTPLMRTHLSIKKKKRNVSYSRCNQKSLICATYILNIYLPQRESTISELKKKKVIRIWNGTLPRSECDVASKKSPTKERQFIIDSDNLSLTATLILANGGYIYSLAGARTKPAIIRTNSRVNRLWQTRARTRSSPRLCPPII